jgi:HAD superfamily hydrolase (TIGR01509 family)
VNVLERLPPDLFDGVLGVVFDLDGTLIDSEKAICAAASLAFGDVGHDVDEAAVADHLGAPLDELYAFFVRDPDPARRTHFVARYLHHHDEHPERNPPALPGVVDGLLQLRARGLPLAVGTTKPTARATQQLDACGLLSHFAHVQGTDPPMRPKPAPDVVEVACRALGIAPSRAVMVGDTARDVGAARAAGSRAVVVAYGAHRLQVAQGFGADAVVHSLALLCTASAAPRPRTPVLTPQS